MAAVNSPHTTIIAGQQGVLEAVVAECEGRGVRARMIPVDYASHSPQVEAVREEILTALADVKPCESSIPFYSTVTGGLLKDTTVCDAAYWYRNLRERVRFEETIGVLAGSGHTAFVEASPHPVLTLPVNDTLHALDVEPALVTGTLRRDEGSLERFHASLAVAFTAGLDVDWHQPA
ncbi:acyltransferase domain-containing protein, partial [Streptomyces odontomachi]|uniref:acyltransferase domain-containing protein n=1 Tax=Streptomyces odontomachi TaxID=2944940 RepID=UPI0027E3706E